MTTPERLRRRQRRESAGIAVLAILLGTSAYWSAVNDAEQRECLIRYIEADSETGKIRSGLVAEESQANRDIIQRVFEGQTTQDRLQAYEDYKAALAEIDRQRAQNPVRQFDPEQCQ